MRLPFNQAQETNRRAKFPLGPGRRFKCARNAQPRVCLEAVAQFYVGQNPELSVVGVVKYIEDMSIDQIASEALRLPPKERAMLAESLWESLVDPFKIPPESDDNEALALALERDRQLETGEVQAISHEEMMLRLRR